MSNASKDQVIKELLDCGRLVVNPVTGEVFAPRSNTPYKPLGAVTKKGYLRTCVNYQGKQHYILLHRVVWIFVHGIPSDPDLQIDHGNRIKTDNRPENLDVVDHDENMRRAKNAGAFAHVGRHDGIRDAKGRFGRKKAGRLLDGKEYNEFPQTKNKEQMKNGQFTN